MSDQDKKQTKTTSGTPAGQADNAAAVQHAKESREKAKAKDENKMHGSHAEAPQQPKKTKAEEKKSGNVVADAITFLKEVAKEAKKITWPPRSQVVQETTSVIVLVALITVMVLGFDYALGNWIFGPIEHFAKMLAPATPEQEMFTPSIPLPTPGTENPEELPEDPNAASAPGTTPSGEATPAPGATIPAGTVTPPPTTPAPTAPPATPGTIPGSTTPGTPATDATKPVTTTPTPAPTAPATTTAPAPTAPTTPTTPHP